MDYLYRGSGNGGGGGDDDRRRNKYRSDDRTPGGFNRSYHDRDDDARRRSRSRSREDRFNKDYSGPKRFGEHREGGGEGRERRYNQNPSKTIMVRSIPLQMSEDDLRTEFNMVQLPYKHIRLVKHRENGQSRGFAFVEFNTVEEASRWIASNQGQFQLSNIDARLALFFSHTDDHTFRSDYMSRRPNNGNGAPYNSSEWTCAKCDVKNFKRRDRCFKCNITREAIIVRGLDALTVEETIMDTLKRLSNHTLSVKTCHIARDPSTHVSDGFAFVEMNTIQDATYMLQVLAPCFEVDGKQIVANYSKNSFKTAISQLQKGSTHQQQQQVTGAGYPLAYAAAPHPLHHGSGGVSQGDRVNSAAAVAQAALISMQKKQEILNQITSNLKQQQQPPSAAESIGGATAGSVDSSIGANLQLLAQQATKTYPPPDPSKFTYDKGSGYYYDFSTGFYYDAASQYYYNSLTQQFMYWDPVNLTYVPVTATGAPVTAATTTAPAQATNEQPVASQPTPEPAATTTDNESKQSAAAAASVNKQPAKTAAQIAKDMERWAASQNKKKEATKKIVSATVASSATANSYMLAAQSTSASSASTSVAEGFGKTSSLFDSLSKTTTPSLSLSSSFDSSLKKTTAALSSSFDQEASNSDSDNSNEQRPLAPALSEPTTAAISRSEETSKTTAADESSFIDLAKMACLLCKRRFDTLDILNKHVAKSDLHKTNLEKLRKESAQERTQEEQDSLAMALQYRDRAKERRQKYGTPEPPSPPTNPSPTPKAQKQKSGGRDQDIYESSGSNSSSKTSASAGDSIANKLMRKMGWNGETGIGKNMQGISAPIEATMRQRGAGLGAAGYTLDPNDTYQDAVKKAARARFEQLNS